MDDFHVWFIVYDTIEYTFFNFLLITLLMIIICSQKMTQTNIISNRSLRLLQSQFYCILTFTFFTLYCFRTNLKYANTRKLVFDI